MMLHSALACVWLQVLVYRSGPPPALPLCKLTQRRCHFQMASNPMQLDRDCGWRFSRADTHLAAGPKQFGDHLPLAACC